MQRAPLGTALLAAAIGVVVLSAPASTQGPRGPRRNIQIVDGREAVAGEALVRFRDGLRAADEASLRGQVDGDAIERLGAAGLVRLRSRSLDAATLVRRLSRRADVLYAEPNYIVHAVAPPNDASFPLLWGLENIGQDVNGGPGGTPGADIHAVPAWDVSVGSTAYVVGVIDTGIDYTHPDLAPNIWTAPSAFTVDLGGGVTIICAAGTHGFNAVARTCNPMDDHNHGTHVAGTIGASGNDGIGVVGVNWTTRLMGIKFLDATGSGSIADAIHAIRFAVKTKEAFAATHGADIRILSNSWGGPGFSQALLDEVNAANAADMLFVAAAGNNGYSNDLFSFYPASYDAPNVVSVAATTNTDDLAWFSNYGTSSVHLGAPGVDILSTTIGNTYAFSSGTSMAAPHVSGAAALVLSRCDLDTAGVRDALIGSVESAPALATRTITGGRLDVNSAMHSCIAPPPAPSSLTATASDTKVTLAWQSSLGATSYIVKRGSAAGGPYVQIATDVKGARYADTAVVNGTAYYYVVAAANPLGQSGDSNEASATPDTPADLIISAFTAPSAAGAGETLVVSATTRNQGGGAAGASTTRIALSDNALLEAGDLRLEPAVAVGPLSPGASSAATLSVTIPAGTPPGVRYLFAEADADGAIEESQEWNNTRLSQITIGPDLVVAGMSVPSTAAPGATISVGDTVRNQGGGAAAASATNFYLSSNSVLDAGDTLLPGARAVPALDPGASSLGSSMVTIPATTPIGVYYVIASADGGGEVAEALESNNTSIRQVRIGGDLVVSVLGAPSRAGAGLTVVVADTTKNQGTAATSSSVTRFYLSSNASLDSADPEIGGGRSVPALGAGETSEGSTTLTIPPGTATGVYYLIAESDADHTVNETIETNNGYARGLQIGGDLAISALTVPATAGAGAAITVTDTTANQGGGAVGATVTRFYFSTNSVLDSADALLGSRAVPALGADATHSASTSLTIPAATTAGSYYVIAKADGNDSTAETQEANNLLARLIQIGGDLALSSFTTPAKGGAGATIVVTDTTVNQGTGTVPATMTRFYLSANSVLDPGDTVLPEARSVPQLAAGASSTGSTLLTLPATTGVGVFYLLAKADADDVVVENQEANNTAVRGIQLGPDLIVSSFTVYKAAPGASLTVTETTTNQGGAQAAVSVTAFYLSVDWILDNGDVPIGGARAVAALDPGAASSASTVLTIPAEAAPGSYYLIAKADSDGTMAETQEANNIAARSTRLGPDLAIVTASLTNNSIATGSTVSITDTAINQGAGTAAASTTRFYLSVNLYLDASDAVLPGSRIVGPLAADTTSSGSTLVTIPANTAPGAYYLLAAADADLVVAESLETNNARIVRGIQVTSPAP